MRIAIIKLGALGDVLRTLPIAKALKKKYENCEITWITKENAFELLKNNKDIDKIKDFKESFDEEFDILYNFDIEEEATDLAKNIRAKKKCGFSSDQGYPTPFNSGAEDYLNTVFDDEVKKTNKKTYQELIFKAAEISYNKEKYEIFLNQSEREYGENFIDRNQIEKDKLIGIHIGASERWPSKAWHIERIREFVKKLREENFEIILFGGIEESEKIERLKNEFDEENIKIFTNDPNNSIREFTSLVNQCKIIVCSDSLALHVSLALGKKCIGLFFCTSPNEVESYGLLEKIVSEKLYDFFPEKMNEYDENLVKSIKVDDVLSAVKRSFKQ